MFAHFKKQLQVFLSLCLVTVTIAGCAQNDGSVEHIVSENSTGYYFDVYSSESKDDTRNGVIKLQSSDDALYFEIENSGQERQFSVQVYLDYQQIPFIVNETEYTTYLVDASSQTSKTYEFHLANSIDDKYNHSLLVILTAGSDVLTNKVDYEMTDQYSIALNHVLSFDKKLPLFSANYAYEKSNVISEQSTGLLLNSDLKSRSRAIPQRELRVKRNETFSLQYQVGGYTDCDEVAVVITIGLDQVQINDQDYLLCQTKGGSLVQGIATFTAPENAGEYELMGWVIKKPFNVDENEYIPLDSAYRFTLVVE